MPVVCGDCGADNPPESRFCHRCGSTLAGKNGVHERSGPPERQLRLRDIGTDLKILCVDIAVYSAPRIKKGSIATGRKTRDLAAIAGPKIRSAAQRIRPRRSEPTPEPGAGPVVATEPMGRSYEPLQPAGPINSLACPRCHHISEPGALFCFSCGLPLDDTVPLPANSKTGQQAGFWIRLWAWIIDFLLLSSLQLGLIGVWPGFSEYFTGDLAFHWVDAIGVVLAVAYYTALVSIWSTTIGKRVLGLYIRQADGGKVGPGRAFARYFAGLVSWVIFGIGYLMIGLRRDKRGLHDLICGTVVVRN